MLELIRCNRMKTRLIDEQLIKVPPNPGVYLLHNKEGDLLYVGKARNLRNRLRSYFGSKHKLPPKLQKLVTKIHNLDFFITNNEQEAMILELNLIKQHRPHYNIRLKDDKTFPYLKISLNEEWPKILITRHLENDGARYFGPFANAKSIRQTLRVIKRIFPCRTCSRQISDKITRPCLWYHIGKCLAPCAGDVSREEYQEVIRQVIGFLEGKSDGIIKELKGKMKYSAETMNFEKAALYRDQIQAIQQVIEAQHIATTIHGNKDVIAFVQNKGQTYTQVWFVRQGKLVGRENFVLQGTLSEEPKQIMTNFIKQFYHSAPNIPPTVLLQYPVEDKPMIEVWLQSLAGVKVKIQVPSQGKKRELVDMVVKNTERSLEQYRIKQQISPKMIEAALDEIKQIFQLPELPQRMECYDISNIQGRFAVGSMVVFNNGQPEPTGYRRFKIRTVSTVNDYAMLEEVIWRRFKHTKKDNNGEMESWLTLPDLILIDGGKGQLSAAQKALRNTNANFIPVFSLSKRNEEIFTSQSSDPIILPNQSPGLQMLQRLRDEAHRFALNYHQKLRKNKTLTSPLDSIPGVGPKRKRSLLKHFGSIRIIRETTEEDLITSGVVNKTIARRIKEYL